MKKIICLVVIAFLSLAFTSSKSLAQNIELDTPQDIVVFGSGFYPFSEEANQTFKELLDENGSVAIIITNLNGNMLKVAPAADFHEIGRKKKVNRDGITVIDFKKKKKNRKKYGLSFVPSMNNITVGVEVQPFAGRPCPSPVSCQDDCGGNLGKCCEKNANGNQSRICVEASLVQIGLGSCSCAKR